MAVDSSAVTFRLVRDDEHAALLEHLNTSFDGWPRIDISVPPIDHLRWKLGDGWPGHVYNYVAELDGKIAAAQLDKTWPVRVGDRELLAQRGTDASVHPDFRGSGIMSRMRPFMIDDMLPAAHFLFGTSTHPAMAKLYEREPRLPFAHNWQAMRCPFSLREALSTFKLRPGRSPRKLARSLGALARWRRTAPAADRSFALRTVERFDDRIDAFSRDACAPFDFAFVRSRDVLNWRYADPRGGKFTVRLAEQHGSILGYAVLRATGGRGYVADLLALPGRIDVVDALARDAIEQLRATGVASAECWLMANHPYVEALRNAGFLGRRVRAAPTFEAMSVPERELSFLCDKDASVHLTIGDMDII